MSGRLGKGGVALSYGPTPFLPQTQQEGQVWIGSRQPEGIKRGEKDRREEETAGKAGSANADSKAKRATGIEENAGVHGEREREARERRVKSNKSTIRCAEFSAWRTNNHGCPSCEGPGAAAKQGSDLLHLPGPFQEASIPSMRPYLLQSMHSQLLVQTSTSGTGPGSGPGPEP